MLRYLIAFLLVAAPGAGAFGQTAEPAYQYIAADGPIALDRGRLSVGQDAVYLNDTDKCRLLVEGYGWETGDCASVDRVVFLPSPEIDTLLVNKPNSEGHVDFADWRDPDRSSEVDAIWRELVEGLKAQSRNLGVPITANRWLTYPTLDEAKGVLYYAFVLDWDGQRVVNVKASIFDRKGYVTFGVVPTDPAETDAVVQAAVAALTGGYAHDAGQRYADFRVGDHVAEAGAVGVLATMVGVKYGKEIASGLLATALIFAKKLWFLLLLPLVWLRRLFRRTDKG